MSDPFSISSLSSSLFQIELNHQLLFSTNHRPQSITDPKCCHHVIDFLTPPLSAVWSGHSHCDILVHSSISINIHASSQNTFKWLQENQNPPFPFSPSKDPKIPSINRHNFLFKTWSPLHCEKKTKKKTQRDDCTLEHSLPFSPQSETELLIVCHFNSPSLFPAALLLFAHYSHLQCSM